MRVTQIPDALPWRAVDDPTVRLGRALNELYAYYRANVQVLGNIIRDLPMMAQVGGVEPSRADGRAVLGNRRRLAG